VLRRAEDAGQGVAGAAHRERIDGVRDNASGWESLTLEIRRETPSGAVDGSWLVSTSDGLVRDTRMSVDPMGMVQRFRAEGWEMITGESAMIGTGDTFVAVFKRPKVTR
jgi:hypothetical protein